MLNFIHPINDNKLLRKYTYINITLLCSSSASAKSLRMLASDSPTYLLRISGPLTTLGSLAFNILPICRAKRVLPQPGGPYNRIPLTCLQPKKEKKTILHQLTEIQVRYLKKSFLSSSYARNKKYSDSINIH